MQLAGKTKAVQTLASYNWEPDLREDYINLHKALCWCIATLYHCLYLYIYMYNVNLSWYYFHSTNRGIYFLPY